MTLLDTALLLFINIIHLIVILIILIIPFSGSNYYLFSYIIHVPFITCDKNNQYFFTNLNST